jgi:hypothetical protein
MTEEMDKCTSVVYEYTELSLSVFFLVTFFFMSVYYRHKYTADRATQQHEAYNLQKYTISLVVGIA